MIKTDFRKWTFRDFMEFTKASQNGEDEQAQVLLLKVMESWEYDAPVTFGGFDDDLNPLQAAEILRDALMAINDEIQMLDTSIVVVNLENWTNRRFKEFLKARSEQNVPKIELMIREVCSMDGFTPEDERPLTFREGARMVRAIMETYQNKLSGKA
jgi:hypothetical protein